MLGAVALAAAFAGISADFAPALDALVLEHRQAGSGDPIVVAQAASDLNGDEVTDLVLVFSYSIGPSMDKSHVEFLTIVSSSLEGYVASWPIIVGSAGRRHIRTIEINAPEIVLYGDFTVSDETASMANLPANGEGHYLYREGRLREQSGSWTRKPNE